MENNKVEETEIKQTTISTDPVNDIKQLNIKEETILDKIINWISNNLIIVICFIIFCIAAFLIYKNKDKFLNKSLTNEQLYFNY